MKKILILSMLAMVFSLPAFASIKNEAVYEASNGRIHKLALYIRCINGSVVHWRYNHALDNPYKACGDSGPSTSFIIYIVKPWDSFSTSPRYGQAQIYDDDGRARLKEYDSPKNKHGNDKYQFYNFKLDPIAGVFSFKIMDAAQKQ